MSHTANSLLRVLSTCVHCGEVVCLARLDNGTVEWTHNATGYYCCKLNSFVMSKRPWSEYIVDESDFRLATPIGAGVPLRTV